jgi:photosystem II stability/assembly factor-like uncharacterized protein
MSNYTYDIFVSHSAADRGWVAEWLIPRLEAAGLAVAVSYRDFLPGAALLDSIEQVVAASRHALVVVTPAWTADEWNAYEARLTHAFDPNARRRKLIPVRLKPCAAPDCLLPRAIADLVMADFTDPRRWDVELARLIRTLRPITPPPAPAAHRPGLDWPRWLGWWFSYRRGRIVGGALAVLALGLAAAALIGWPTFAGWRPLGPPIPQAWRLHRAGDILLVSTATDAEGCAIAGQGLWRSADGGQTWRAVNAPLRVTAAGQGCFAAAIVDFGHAAAAPQTIYAATTNAGLLRSADGGVTWARVGAEALPDALARVAVAPADANRVWVAGVRGGLFRSQDGGLTWARLDRAAACAAGARPLPEGFTAGALLATADALYAGDWLDNPKPGIYPGPDAGLYASRDGGACWRQMDRAEGRYSYAELREAPAGQLLALVMSHQAGAGSYAYELWLVTAEQGRARRVWASCDAAAGLFAGPGAAWAVATAGGGVMIGSADLPAAGDAAPCQSFFARLTGADSVGGRPLPPVRRCALPPLCFSDLAADDRWAAPLLLMGDRVYRLDRVAWPQAAWP